MKAFMSTTQRSADRRAFLKTSVAAAGAAAVGAGLTASESVAFGDVDESDRPVRKGDIDILRFLAAIEILETDLWQQYNELGGIQDKEVPGGN